MRLLLSFSLLVALAAPCLADDRFEKPVRLTTAGQAIGVESPGYAAPWLQDMDGDGIRDLLVGQFNKGKISYFKGTANGATDFAAHAWLQAGGEVASVPGVW